MEENSDSKWMQRYYPGCKYIGIEYDAGEWGTLCAYVSNFESKEVTDALIGRDELVIKDDTITILFDYPLTNKATFEYKNEGGFTRYVLYKCIYEGYKKIYDEETEDSGDPGTYERLYNRRTSQGRYGIWGHYMNDLRIEGVAYNPETRDVLLIMGS